MDEEQKVRRGSQLARILFSSAQPSVRQKVAGSNPAGDPDLTSQNAPHELTLLLNTSRRTQD